MTTKTTTATATQAETTTKTGSLISRRSLTENFMAARAIGTPLMSITCPDPEVTMKRLIEALKSKNENVPIVQWDCVRGWKSRTTEGTRAMKKVLDKYELENEVTKNPIRQLVMAEDFPADTCLFILNAHHRTHSMERPDFWQALWNLRDVYKSNFRTAVLLSPQITLPIDVSSDVLCLEEGLPDETEMAAIVEEIVAMTEYKYNSANRKAAAKALVGLTPFAAEQAVALALRPEKIDVDDIFERKRELLNEIPGLSVYSGTETFADLGGCDEVKMLLYRVIRGKEPPELIVFIDEGEKAMAGATHQVGDNTGVSQDFMGTLLSYMEDHESDGTIFVGPTGTAKSALAKAMGNEAKIPTVFLDIGGLKSSLLGASEHRIRHALKVIDSLGHGRVFFIMTSNNISKIPPEFKRRFASGVFFFDIPSDEERSKIWDIHLKKYGVDKKEVNQGFSDEDWTGAEIRNCVRMAYRHNTTLAEASKFIVPVAVSGADGIRQLRKAATGNFLSANLPGTYKYVPKED